MFFERRKQNKQWRMAELAEAPGDCSNPGRGWYRIYTFRPAQRNQDELDWLSFEETETLALVRLVIEDFREREIDEETLAFTERIFRRFGEAGKQMILRITYDTEGKGMEHEPSRISLVLTHMRQLGALARRFADDIFVCQGLFVGNWGEMHGSKFLAPEDMRRLAATWREAVGEAVPISFRKAVFCRIVCDGQEPCPIGLFDDALFAGADHLGTFGSKSRAQADWMESWRMEDELAFLWQTAPYTPCGGEALLPENPEQEACMTPEETVRQLRQMRISYLNCIYDERILTRWKQQPSLQKADSQQSLYNYIGAHLGYRFVVRSAKVLRKKERLCRIVIENTGFAGILEQTQLFLTDGKTEGGKEVLVACDLRTLGGGELAEISAVLPCGWQGNVYLLLRRKKDGKVIRFANQDAKEQVLLGCMQTV